MRRRTRKLSSSRAVVYIVLLVFVWGARYIYNNYAPTAESSTPETTTLVTPLQAQPEESPRKDDVPKHRLSGWAELPAERNKQELYYAYHLIEEEDSADKRRNYAVCFNSDKHCPVWVAAAMHPSFTGDTKRIDS